MKTPPHILTRPVHLSQLLAMDPVDSDGLAVIPYSAIGPVCMRCIRSERPKVMASYDAPRTLRWPVTHWERVDNSLGILCFICGNNLPMANPAPPEPVPWDLRHRPSTRHELLRALHTLIKTRPMFLCPAADSLSVDIWPVLLEDFGRRGPLNTLLSGADMLTISPELFPVAYQELQSPAHDTASHQALRLAYLRARLTLPDKLGLQ